MGYAYFFLILVLTVALIPFGGAAQEGAANGIRLFANCLLPSLFPFVVCSKLLIGNSVSRGLLLSDGKLSHIFRFMAAALCGTPSAALIYNESVTAGCMGVKRASVYCALFNLANPGFVIYALSGSMMKDNGLVLLFTISHYVPSLIAAAILSIPRKQGSLSKTSINSNSIGLLSAIDEGVWVMLRIGGTVVFFGVLFKLLEKAGSFAMFHNEIGGLVRGLIEMTNGLASLSSVGTRLSVSLCSFLLSFGGICIYAQSKLVFPRLSLALYLPVKLLMGAVSLAIAYSLYPLFASSVAVFGNMDSGKIIENGGYHRTVLLICCVLSSVFAVIMTRVFSRVIKKGGRSTAAQGLI